MAQGARKCPRHDLEHCHESRWHPSQTGGARPLEPRPHPDQQAPSPELSLCQQARLGRQVWAAVWVRYVAGWHRLSCGPWLGCAHASARQTLRPSLTQGTRRWSLLQRPTRCRPSLVSEMRFAAHREASRGACSTLTAHGAARSHQVAPVLTGFRPVRGSPPLGLLETGVVAVQLRCLRLALPSLGRRQGWSRRSLRPRGRLGQWPCAAPTLGWFATFLDSASCDVAPRFAWHQREATRRECQG